MLTYKTEQLEMMCDFHLRKGENNNARDNSELFAIPWLNKVRKHGRK
jgi:hypothetical protein